MKLANLSRCLLVESDSKGNKRITVILYDENEFNKLIQTNLMLFINSCKNIKEQDFVKKLQEIIIK